ncbi:MAG TPA: hypothetical protein VJL59_26255 [Anaerolineales bacterium]|nr:hypothetical protein [Anaerolineales bacterium]
MQTQDHWLDSLAFQIRQLTTQVKQKPIALFTALKNIPQPPLECDQRFNADLHIPRRQLARRLTTTGWRFSSAIFVLLFHGGLLDLGVASE